jgi:endoglucanase
MISSKFPRRKFLRDSAIAAAGLFVIPNIGPAHILSSSNKLPRWRGFNLLEKFDGDENSPYMENDFKMIHDFGFDFVRLPMSYRCWSKPDNWMVMDENVLKEIDQAVEFGRKHKIHVNLNLHRIPGYCVNPPAEPLNLWKDEKALDAAAYHWQQLAKRYKGISSDGLSFDLINEPANVSEEDYTRVVRRIVDAIRSEDATRLIIADGLQYGTRPVESFKGMNLGQSTRGYAPFQLTHYRAGWVNGSDQWPEPTWPFIEKSGKEWNKETLRNESFSSWKKLADSGIGIHVGEWGAYNRTPHQVVLPWMKANLEIWKEYGWGWSLWNFRGEFGVLDSERSDVTYEDFMGHKLDREMLKLLQAY